MNPLAWLKIWKLPQQLASLAIGLLLLFGLGWYVNYKLKAYYTADLNAAVKASQVKAEAANLARTNANLERENKAIENHAKTLQKNLDDATATADSRSRLLNTIRASEANNATLATCVQRANTLAELLESGTELAGRIAKAADGHVADKVMCLEAWPK